MSVKHESPILWPEQRRFYSLLMYFEPSEHSGKWNILPKRVTIHVWKQHHSIPTPIDTIYWNLAAAPWRCVSNTTSIPYYLLQTNLWKYLVAASIVFQYSFQVSKTNLPIPAMFSPSEVPVKKHISTILALFGQSLLHQTDLASISRDGRCHMCHK